MNEPALVCRSSYIGFSSSSNTTIFCRNQSSPPKFRTCPTMKKAGSGERGSNHNMTWIGELAQGKGSASRILEIA